ncbi:MAG: LytTR family transcriptional regulator DNA-binding domain-containing protein [Lachnospiraceae bacterium]|nr:LytTR family transcriptional regulator DNA-binding domain-containing protein [Lachnospiraceae bacterium]
MTRILILEDSKDCLNAIAAMLEKVSDRVCAVPVNSLEEARAALEEEAQPPFQAFLLDINLDINDKDDISGITFAREVRLKREYAFTPIVMITSLANMELTAYRELHCYQYLIKPYNQQDIEKLAGKLLFLSQQGETRDAFVVVKKDSINYKIFCKDIVCVKAVPRGVQLVLLKEEMKVPYLSVKQLLERLPDNKFLQVHRMCVVNQDYIDYVDTVNGFIHMKNGEQVEIGITFKRDIKKKLYLVGQ